MKTSSVFYLLLISISFSNLSAQKSLNSVVLIPKWNKGEVRRYEINYTSQTTTDKLESATRKTQRFNIKVVNINKTSLKMLWKFEKVNFIDSIPSYNPALVLMNTLTDTLTVQYTISNKGVIESIDNYEEISSNIKIRIDSTIQQIIRDPRTDQSKIQMLKLQFKMMFSTNGQINSIVLNDVFKFHELYGTTYLVNKVVAIDELPKVSNLTGKFNMVLQPFNKNDKVYSIIGNKTNPGFEDVVRDRKTLLQCKFKFPGNWLTEYFFDLETSSGLVTKSSYSMRLIE